MLQEFNHITFGRMRVIVIDSKPWFIALDSYKITGVDSRWIRYAVDKADISRIDRHTIGITGKCPPYLIILSERGICAFARKYAGNNARPYIQWIHEIAQQCLPAQPEPVGEAALLDKIVADPDFGIRLLMELKAEREKNADLSKRLEAAAEKTRIIDTIMDEFSKYKKLSA